MAQKIHTDYIDLNRVCGKDCFTLHKIYHLMNSANAYVLLSFVDGIMVSVGYKCGKLIRTTWLLSYIRACTDKKSGSICKCHILVEEVDWQKHKSLCS